jgi:hypothetical protein
MNTGRILQIADTAIAKQIYILRNEFETREEIFESRGQTWQESKK